MLNVVCLSVFDILLLWTEFETLPAGDVNTGQTSAPLHLSVSRNLSLSNLSIDFLFSLKKKKSIDIGANRWQCCETGQITMLLRAVRPFSVATYPDNVPGCLVDLFILTRAGLKQLRAGRSFSKRV